MPLPKNYEFSPFVLRSKQDAMKSAPKPKLFYGLQETDEAHDTTTLYKPRVREDIKQSIPHQYDRFLTATQDASKSFNHYRPDGIIYRPSQIIELHNEGGDVLEKLDRMYDLEDGYNVAAAEVMRTKAPRRK
jgi:hypothetical protein